MVELLLFLGADVYPQDCLGRDAEAHTNSEYDKIGRMIKKKKDKMDVGYDMTRIREYERNLNFRNVKSFVELNG